MTLFTDKNYCHCHPKQQFQFTPSEVDSLNKHATHDGLSDGQVHFLLAYYYISIDREKAIEHANLAIQNGCGIAYNTLGCIENKIEHFIKAAIHNNTRAYRNMGELYHASGDINRSKQCLQLGIDLGINCCQYIYYDLYCTNDPDYDDVILNTARKGCRSALDESFGKTTDPTIRQELLNLGVQCKYTFYIIKMINQYDASNDRYRLIRILRQFEDSNDGDLMFTIGKKYMDMSYCKYGTKCILKALDLGCYDVLEYLGNNVIVALSSDNCMINCIMQSTINLLTKRSKLDPCDQLNLVLAYVNTNQPEQAHNVIQSVTDPYYQNMCYSLCYPNDPDKTLMYLMQAHSLDPNGEIQNLHQPLSVAYARAGNTEQCLYHLTIGATQPPKCYKCVGGLAQYYYDRQRYVEAYSYVFDLLENGITVPFINALVYKYATIDIGERFIKNGIYAGIACLINCDVSTSQIVDLCKNSFVTKGICPICCTSEDLFTVQCGHSYCLDCVKHDMRKCPFCRSGITSFLKNVN
jgi:tetratricopeptide (TPR) repeat protein